jgi:hypothetical protein
MGGDILDLYSDYLLANTRKTTTTGLLELVDGAISHYQITRFLAGEEPDGKSLWLKTKKLIRQYESREDRLIFDDTIVEKAYMDENEIICRYYDHSKGRNIKGINILFVFVVLFPPVKGYGLSQRFFQPFEPLLYGLPHRRSVPAFKQVHLYKPALSLHRHQNRRLVVFPDDKVPFPMSGHAPGVYLRRTGIYQGHSRYFPPLSPSFSPSPEAVSLSAPVSSGFQMSGFGYDGVIHPIVYAFRDFTGNSINCGFQNKRLELSDRKCTCPECETKHNCECDY